MDIRNRFFGRIATYTHPDKVRLQPSTLIEYLLLFDKVIIESIRLKDIRELISFFGYQDVMALLKSGVIDIYCDAISVASIGQTSILEQRRKKGVLPLGSYSFNIVRTVRKEYMHTCFKEIHGIDDINFKQTLKLKNAIAERLKSAPEKGGQETLEQLKADLRNNIPVLRTAVSLALDKKYALKVEPNQFSLQIKFLDEDDFHAESNLSKLLGLDEQQVHSAIESGLLAVGGLNLRIESMKNLNALTGLRDMELPVFDNKLLFLEQHFDPLHQTQLLRRVLEIIGFPDLANLQRGSINLQRLLEIRESDECRSFRSWLRNSEGLSKSEIEEQFGSIRAKLGSVVHGTAGKAVRWIASTGIGLIPGYGNVIGGALGLIDSFLLEKLLPKSGPVAFLGKLYPSIFKNDD